MYIILIEVTFISRISQINKWSNRSSHSTSIQRNTPLVAQIGLNLKKQKVSSFLGAICGLSY